MAGLLSNIVNTVKSVVSSKPAQPQKIISPLPSNATMKQAGGTWNGQGANPATQPRGQITSQAASTTTRSSGGGGSAPSSSPQPSYDIEGDYDARRAEEERIRAERESRIREGISAAYAPIYAELDRQIQFLPEDKKRLEDQVGTLAQQQVGDVNLQKEQRLKEIEGYRADETDRSKGSLRDLEDNIRNILQSASFYLGSRNAGDSSATGAASEAIAKTAQKSRAGVLNLRDQAFRQLDQKAIQIGDVADQQLKKIDDYKTNKLFEVAQWATDKLNELNGRKASAQGKEAEALFNLIEQTETEFTNAIRALDSEVSDYKKSINTWQMQRQADLEDFKTKMSMTSSYSKIDPKKYNALADPYGRGVTFYNPYDPFNDRGSIQTPFSVGQDTSQKSGGLSGLLDLVTGRSQDTFQPTADPRTQLQF